MSSASIGYVNTARTLAALSTQRATGSLTLTSGDRQWKLFFFHGRLLYGTGNIHRARRWYRAVRQHGDTVKTVVPMSEPWEYQLLSHYVTHNHLSVSQARAVIKASLEEVLFSWVSHSALSADWSPLHRLSLQDNAGLSLLLSSPQVERVLQRSQQLWQQWTELELSVLNPYAAPILKQSLPVEPVSATQIPDRLHPFLTGQHTLWDIASHAQRPVTTVTRFLLPWVQQGAITLQEIPDLPSPNRPQCVESVLSDRPARPLIACIDDSPTVGQVLESMLKPAGYRVLKIQEPLAGIALLAKHKPDLIFLDLVMPDTSGYNLCSFLRRTPMFNNTPIVILTSQDGLIDRTRARLCGASDFLAKPPDPQMLLNLVQTHLRSVLPPS